MSIGTFAQLLASSSVSLGEAKVAKSLASKNLFLSHSRRDAQLVPSALGLLEEHGASVYVDLKDHDLDDLPNTAVAGRIRSAIGTCNRLVVLVTENTSTSRWIPWEVGVADGLATSAQVATLPVRATSSSSEQWAQQEYFNLYPRVEYVTLAGQEKPTWAVRDPSSGRFWTLNQWLNLTRRA